jgi:hypothetical protein
MPLIRAQYELMTVLVNGVEEKRYVNRYEIMHGMRVPVPECREDESYQFILGDTRPMMFKIR